MPTNQVSASRRWPTAIDLFCGCGGVTAGLKAARFRVIAAVDNDPIACRTYRANHPSVRLMEKDITEIDPRHIRENLLRHGTLDLLVVCAPCQPFSSHQRTVAEDDRVSLMLQAIRFADALQPRLILFENVPGIEGPRFRTLRDSLMTGLRDQGYHFGTTMQLDAADFGVPQRRVRCIMLASKDHTAPELPQSRVDGRQATVRTAVGDLKPLRSGKLTRMTSCTLLGITARLPWNAFGTFLETAVAETACLPNCNFSVTRDTRDILTFTDA